MGPLRELALAARDESAPVFRPADAVVFTKDILSGSCLDADAEALRGRTILILTKSQLSTALALLELDGLARRLVLCTPEIAPGRLAEIVATAGADTVVCDAASWDAPLHELKPVFVTALRRARSGPAARDRQTEWVLLTSGTTGTPKLVVHDLSTLTGAAMARQRSTRPMLWGTFYDIRRYGGLQIFLRALVKGGTLLLPDPHESPKDFVDRAASLGVGFISGTPSHWRRALMSGVAHRMRPRHVRLSGEIADQAILDRLNACYTDAGVVHAFASTEAGVAFEITDGREGFPASLLGRTQSAVGLKVVDSTLRIRSPRMARRTLGAAAPIADADGFVDTRDIIEQREERCYFAGRSDGTINVGGNKIHPEEVEAALNRHPRVEASRAGGRRNPVTGALIEADVVLGAASGLEAEFLCKEILAFCARALPPHKRPVALHVVPSLALGAAGKLERNRA
jgi:acyl-coenzyme A synthetase/AMP-(fatty) acid ligase